MLYFDFPLILSYLASGIFYLLIHEYVLSAYFPVFVDSAYIPSFTEFTQSGFTDSDISESTELSIFVKEHAENGTVVGILNQQLPFLQSYSSLRYQIHSLGPTLGTLRLQLTSESNDSTDALFKIDPISSTIRVISSNRLDREHLCPFASGNEKECSLTYGVTITGTGQNAPPLTPQQSWIRIKIIVQDINDNAPKFGLGNNSIEHQKEIEVCRNVALSEDASVGTKVRLQDAVDLDSLINGQPIYQLNCADDKDTTSNHPFALYHSRSTNGINQIWLQLRYPLDHEQKNAYNCTLAACDNGTPILCTYSNLCITVHDVNDNSPVFNNQNTSIILNEDVVVGSRVARINATDADSGAFGNVKFDIVGGGNDVLNVQRHFLIDASNGDLILTSRLRGGTNFNFWVEARDGGEPESRMTRTAISIFVVDVNDHAPEIDILPAAVRIRANSLGSKSLMSRVSRVPCEYRVQQSHMGDPYECNERKTRIQIFEDNVAPTNIAYIRVSDADVGENAHVDCQLVQDDDILLAKQVSLIAEHQISSRKTMFKLVLETSFDCESSIHASQKSVCNSDWTLRLRIQCHDFGDPIKRTFHSIFLEIMDVNEYPPIFEKGVYMVELKENIPIGSNVIQVAVSDLDAIPHGQKNIKGTLPSNYVDQTLRFILDSLNSNPFGIDHLSGRIYTTHTLDAENVTEYNLQVTAINTGFDNVTLNSTCQIHVHVMNINDNAPVFLKPKVFFGALKPNSSVVTIQVSENIPNGTVFAQIQTEDPDQRDEDKQIIRIQHCKSIMTVGESSSKRSSRNSVTKFEVDKHSGRIWTVSNLDREKADIYECLITADDGEHDLGLTSSMTIVIQVLDENDNFPVWLYPRAPDDSRIQLGVEFPTNRIITRVRAIDMDIGVNAQISYSLDDALFVHFSHPTTCDLMRLFSLNRDNGLLRMLDGNNTSKKPHDCFQPGDFVRLVLRATDSGIPPLSKEAEFYLEFKVGSDMVNLPLRPESSFFLTQADDAEQEASHGDNSFSSSSSKYLKVEKSQSLEEGENDNSKRMRVFVLMIVVPLGAILLCCCLITTLLFVIRSRRNKQRRVNRNYAVEGIKQGLDREFLHTSSATSTVDQDLAPTLTDQQYVHLVPRSNYAVPKVHTSETPIFYTTVTSASLTHMTKFDGLLDITKTTAGVEFNDTVSGESLSGEREFTLDGGDKLLYTSYPIYLKQIDAPPENIIRLSSIQELDGNILLPLAKNDVTPFNSTMAQYQSIETSTGMMVQNRMLMACVVPETDKSSADSGHGQSEEDAAFNHEGLAQLPAGFFYVPVQSGIDSMRLNTDLLSIHTNKPDSTTTINPALTNYNSESIDRTHPQYT